MAGDSGADHGQDAADEVARVARRVTELEEIASAMRVAPRSIAVSDLQEAHGELAAIKLGLSQIEHLPNDQPVLLDWARERLRAIAITLQLALYMSGVNSGRGPSIYELREQLERFLETSA